jgi:acetoin utilization deacetylase AcuC-like enzyme
VTGSVAVARKRIGTLATVSRTIPVVTSGAHLAHDGLVEVMAGQPIPCFERPERITEIERALSAAGAARFLEPMAHGREPILAVHDLELVDLLEQVWTDAVASGATDGTRCLIPDTFLVGPYAASGYGGEGTSRTAQLGSRCLDTATPIVEGTFRASLAAVDVALTAADLVLSGEPVAYALCRPPGHHAARSMYGGYCFFNNAAIVAESLAAGGPRVAILDIDYHHGNGTQQIFWERGDVLYVSLHADPARAFPYFSGHASERGAGDAAGTTLNFPMPRRAGIAEYSAALDAACERIASFGPGAPLIVSLGFDTFERDPIADLALRTEDYATVAARIAALGMPMVLIQEGGYAIDAIGANAVSFLSGVQA